MDNISSSFKDMPANCTPLPGKKEITIGEIKDKSLLLTFEGGNVSSDAGVLLLREVEEQNGLIKAMSEVIPDNRDSRCVRHALTCLLIQRVGQIVCGYEDANDCDDLRRIFLNFYVINPPQGAYRMFMNNPG